MTITRTGDMTTILLEVIGSRPDCRLGTVANSKLREDSPDMCLCRIRADTEDIGDLFVGKTSCDQPEDLLLSKGKGYIPTSSA